MSRKNDREYYSRRPIYTGKLFSDAEQAERDKKYWEKANATNRNSVPIYTHYPGQPYHPRQHYTHSPPRPRSPPRSRPRSRERSRERSQPQPEPVVIQPIENCPSNGLSPPITKTKAKFREQALIFHPDKNSGCIEEATRKFQELQRLSTYSHGGGKSRRRSKQFNRKSRRRSNR